MQTHLKRAFTLLFIVIIVFLAVRSVVIPESFGQYGWYRGDSVIDNMNNQVEHAGSASCGEEECHKTLYSIWADAGHKTVNCETCHGPSEKHVNDAGIELEAAEVSREACGICHFKRIARPEEFPQIDPVSHGENLECAFCHNPHKPWFI